jgi:hypothetical protein
VSKRTSEASLSATFIFSSYFFILSPWAMGLKLMSVAYNPRMT